MWRPPDGDDVYLISPIWVMYVHGSRTGSYMGTWCTDDDDDDRRPTTTTEPRSGIDDDDDRASGRGRDLAPSCAARDINTHDDDDVRHAPIHSSCVVEDDDDAFDDDEGVVAPRERARARGRCRAQGDIVVIAEHDAQRGNLQGGARYLTGWGELPGARV